MGVNNLIVQNSKGISERLQNMCVYMYFYIDIHIVCMHIYECTYFIRVMTYMYIYRSTM